MAVEVSNRLPIDILHISDLHFATWYHRDKKQERWRTFLGHITEVVEAGEHRPRLIAFTGDLVNWPGRPNRKAMNEGVTALVDLAEACGLLPVETSGAAGVDDGIPSAWWRLLNRRLFVVPGNHDLFPSGLRVLWSRWPSEWRRIVARQGELAAGEVLPRREVVAGPLRIHLLDSNGRRSFYQAARGIAEPGKPAPPSRATSHFGVALVHAHPVQLCFLQQGITERESSLLMENAGLFIKNLVSADVRLVLHGHKHYPDSKTLMLRDQDGRTRSIVIAGAGSVTSPPKKWTNYSFNWIRIHQDCRVEVSEMRCPAGGNRFAMAPHHPYLADRGDFQFDAIEKRVALRPFTGDMEVVITMSGLRATSGRAVSEIPLELTAEDPASLAVSCFRVLKGGTTGTKVRWSEDFSRALIEPPQRPDYPPLKFQLVAFVHNAKALTRWEARQFCRGDTDCERVRFKPIGRAGICRIEVVLPREYDYLTRRLASIRVVKNQRRQDELGHALSSSLSVDRVRDQLQVSKGGEKSLSISIPRPDTISRYEISWELPPPQRSLPDELEKALLFFKHWHERLLRDHDRGNLPLQNLCQGIASRFSDYQLPESTDLSLFVPDNRDAPVREGARRLALVGASRSLQGSPSLYGMPFGAGVVGRAYRTGGLYRYDFLKAQRGVLDFQTTVSGGSDGWDDPSNYFRQLVGEAPYSVLLAVPIFPDYAFQEQGVAARPSHATLAMLAIGSTSKLSPLLSWGSARTKGFVEDMVTELEERFYFLAEEAAQGA